LFHRKLKLYNKHFQVCICTKLIRAFGTRFWVTFSGRGAAASLFSGSPAGISFYQRGISRTFCPQLWRRRAYNIKFILGGVGKAFYFQHRSGRKEEEKITIALSDGALALSGRRARRFM